MSPSDVIRKRLDERGIEHRDIAKDKDGNVLTAWSASALDGALVTARENPKADTDKLMVTLGKRYLTPEQAIAATVGNGTDLSKRLREVTGLRSFAELFGFDWHDDSDWDWHDVACAMADTIDATAGNTITLDEATERIEQFMGDYAKVLLASTLYVERDEPTDQHAFDVAERKEAQMARDLAEALATVGVGTCKAIDTGYATARCSECGTEFMGSIMTNEPPDYVKPLERCPRCGRRIIEEVTE